ncbi:M23 family metallopeptidase [Vibrio coralliilyticus]|uniref:M23 family metallopeptidase n=1 Tax=Vibrio coralliilyticus TaxID=190893 RepID=UPI00148D0A01|nr:M23 family metallopeptidase [Vibrio coralliilyticus]NOH54334.1 M23 family metallopeptidase [Vibrio coralliilyticus]
MKTQLGTLLILFSAQGFSHSILPTIDTGELNLSTLEQHNIPTLLTEQSFVYRPVTYPFLITDYFDENSKWLVLEEELNHWSGAMGVDPRVTLATLAVSHGWTLNHTLSEAELEQVRSEIRHVANRLSQFFYHTKQQLETQDLAATYAVVSSLQSVEQWPKWQTFYSEQFGTPIADEETSFVSPPDMQWPWRVGYNWIPNGPHSHTGSGYPLSSVDVSYDWPRWGEQTYSVTAAHEGYVSVFSRCQLRVTAPNGWATNYYHMDGIQVQDGAWVSKNQKIGTYASQRNIALCQGGSSTGPHLHFSLLYNGRFESLQDISFGPHTIDVGRYSYDNHCSYTWMLDARTNSKRCFWYRVDNP